VYFRNKIIFGAVFFLIFSLTIPANAEVEPPKKQMKKGIAVEDIVCKTGLNLVIRNNGAPACLKPSTAEIFQEKKNQQFNLEMHKMKLRAFQHPEERLQISTLQMMI
jgi:hypothetical protein